MASTTGLVRWLRGKPTPRAQTTLAQLLARITLRKDEQGDASEAEPNQVTLCTLHGSKGLDFNTVFLIGAVEGQLPHTRITDPKVTEAAPTDVEEERRLFYVGVTRARDRLYITRPEARLFRGEAQKLTPSRFLNGLPEDVLEEYTRKEVEPLDFNEVADLGREFLARLSGKASAPPQGT